MDSEKRIDGPEDDKRALLAAFQAKVARGRDAGVGGEMSIDEQVNDHLGELVAELLPWALFAAQVVLDDEPGAHESFGQEEARELLGRFRVPVPLPRHLAEAHHYTRAYLLTQAGEVLRQQHERLHAAPVDHEHPVGEEPW